MVFAKHERLAEDYHKELTAASHLIDPIRDQLKDLLLTYGKDGEIYIQAWRNRKMGIAKRYAAAVRVKSDHNNPALASKVTVDVLSIGVETTYHVESVNIDAYSETVDPIKGSLRAGWRSLAELDDDFFAWVEEPLEERVRQALVGRGSTPGASISR